MKPTVYIETTVPSYYCDQRVELAGDIARTREWWDRERGDYECFISPVVIDELSAGNYPTQVDCLDLIKGLPSLDMNTDVLEVALAYLARKLMPKDPAADAAHLALACYYRMDYLLTWNCRHLANANKARHLEVLNVQLGLGVPRLVTPHLLQPLEDLS